MVSQMTDRDIWKLTEVDRSHKVCGIYSAVQNKGTPTVILAKTIEAMEWVNQEKYEYNSPAEKLDEKDFYITEIDLMFH